MTLALYIVRRYLWNILRVQIALFFLILLIDTVELLRVIPQLDGSFARALQLGLLRAPAIVIQILPLVILLAALATFLGLARSSELVIGRASGQSALRLIAPTIITTLLLGAIITAVFNPIVAATQRRAATLTEQYKFGTATLFSLGAQSIWLRQGVGESQYVIQADRASNDGTRLFQVRFYQFDQRGRILSRVEAGRAELANGFWLLSDTKRWRFLEELDEGASDITEQIQLRLPTELTSSEILESFSAPREVSFWELRTFIDRLERSGFSAQRHRVFFQSELARPLYLTAMMLIGIGFSMRHSRFGQTGVMVLSAVMSGFIVYALKSLSESMGAAQEIPVIAAAWGAPLAAVLLALTLILHLEDG
ncbi:MAG: LPS export ABC transporter permease LptG [Paracoccaceae bacterium]